MRNLLFVCLAFGVLYILSETEFGIEQTNVFGGSIAAIKLCSHTTVELELCPPEAGEICFSSYWTPSDPWADPGETYDTGFGTVREQCGGVGCQELNQGDFTTNCYENFPVPGPGPIAISSP